MNRTFPILVSLVVFAALAPPARAVRIKDITEIEGARPNQLFGMGLVVGLEQTGGRSLFTQQMAVDMIEKFNVTARTVSIDRLDNVYRSGNISVVMVTAELGPFARKGSHIDVMVSVLDDATSLQGGTLILTPLRGADRVDYAVAQGPLSLGGFLFTIPTGTAQPLASSQKNHPTVGRIPGGAIVEREARGEIICNGRMRLLLRAPDYVTAGGITKSINARFSNAAMSLDAGTIHVTLPASWQANVVSFVGEVGLLEVTPDNPARVIINEKTGTIVAGDNVRISTVAIAHANLSITTDFNLFASQPAPFTTGQTAILPEADLRITEQRGTLKVVDAKNTITVARLAHALNLLGVTPRDLIAIFQTLYQAGALHAELVLN